MARSRHLAGVVLLLIAGACADPKPTTGSLIVTIDGLPPGVQSGVSVVGPSGYFKQVPATTTLDRLAPGSYSVVVSTVTFAQALYASAQLNEAHTIVAGHTEASHVVYALASGSINFIVTGLPADVAPVFRLTPTSGGSTRSIFAAGIVQQIPSGTYTLRADTVNSTSGDKLAASALEQQIVVPASLTPVDVSVGYTLGSGTIDLSVSGLPGNVTPVLVTGPFGYARATGASVTLRGLAPGTYSIAAGIQNGACPDVYTPSLAHQNVDVSVGATSPATVTYTLSQAATQDLNLTIDGLYLVQAVQDYSGNVPLVAGRPALLRVFGRANQCNTAKPKVKVTLSTGDVFTIDPGDDSVRVNPDQGTLAGSWNVVIPGSAVQPGLGVVAEIDPDGTVPEANEGDNRYPASGSVAVDVRVMPVVHVRFVPIALGGFTANVAGDSLLTLARRIHPVADYDWDVHATYTSTHGLLLSDANAWGAVLGEIEALRVADNATRYYAGVVHVTYTSGVAGLAYVGGKSSLIWDYMPSGAEVIAHELGHNYDRLHSPCGNPGGVDGAYPYLGGLIGKYGFDVTTGVVKLPDVQSDIMGYCNNKWISDYTYIGMLNYLTANPSSIQAPSPSLVPSLLVWGRIVDGEPVLEPAYEIMARPSLPASGGPNRLVALDDAGTEIFSLAFEGSRVADVPNDQRTFAFAVPLSMLQGRSLAALRLTNGVRSVTSVPGANVAADAGAQVTRTGSRAARVRWDATKFPGLMIRDAASGEILSFARGGDATVVTPTTGALELVYSNRVRSGRVVLPLR